MNETQCNAYQISSLKLFINRVNLWDTSYVCMLLPEWKIGAPGLKHDVSAIVMSIAALSTHHYATREHSPLSVNAHVYMCAIIVRLCRMQLESS